MERRIKDFYGIGNENKEYAERVYNDFVNFLTNMSHDRFFNENKNIEEYIPSKYLEGIDINNGLNNKKFYNLYLNLFLIFKFTKYKYNLNEIEELVLEENFSEAIKNHSILVKTDDNDYCVYRDSKDCIYTLEIDKEFIDKVRLLSNFEINKKSTINLGMDIYNFYNHPIFKEDVKLNNNNDLLDIITLTKYTKNIDLINRYLKLLNTNDKQYKKLLLEFIKPISEDVTFNEKNEASISLSSICNDNDLFLNFNIFIRNNNIDNDLDKCLKYYKYYNINMNIYCFKLFENYFIYKIDELENISNLDDKCEIMISLIKFKNSIIKNILNFNNAFDEVDFDTKKCDQLKVEFDNIFSEFINIEDKNENNKVKVKGELYV